MRFFNTEGPILPEDHYHVLPLSRLDLAELLELIARKRYFVLHAPRQTGKTTTLGALETMLNASGRYRCVYVNVEAGQAAGEDVRAAMQAILAEIGWAAERVLEDDTPGELWPGILERTGPETALRRVLSMWAASDATPLVVLMDEIDTLTGDALLSVLRQLRTGYRDRPGFFPQSVILCGVHDVRDYRIHASSQEKPVLGGSAFNVKAGSLRLGDFSEAEVRVLLGQHVTETGQRFREEALKEIWRLTRGQPWLVNALARELCFEKEGVRDRDRDITLKTVHDARERLILRRDTHIDQLAERLGEPRVQRVIEPLLSGSAPSWDFRPDDIRYVRDLGLVKQTDSLSIANPIYREVIPRELTHVAQAMLPHDAAWHVGADGRVHMARLLRAFQDFFRENSEHWTDRFHYREAGPQLLLQAFVHRVVNSGGRIEREYGVGRRRMDLAVIWPLPKRSSGPGRGPTRREQRVVIECKVVHRGVATTIREGLVQTAAYMELWDAEEGHLVLFDRRPRKPWDEKIFRREDEHEGRRITVWGM